VAVVERLRALLEHPLDPRLARAVVALACCVTLGFAAVMLLAETGASPTVSSEHPAAAPSSIVSPTPPRPPLAAGAAVRQDPQDRLGSAAHRRAAREIAGHRALQHVPYRAGGVVIDLVGARGDRAVLVVRATTLAAARRGWRAFLHRYRDDGRAYLPRFRTGGGLRG
jgi:hypothetical protein